MKEISNIWVFFPCSMPHWSPSVCTVIYSPVVPLCLHPILFPTGASLSAPYSISNWCPPLLAPCNIPHWGPFVCTLSYSPLLPLCLHPFLFPTGVPLSAPCSIPHLAPLSAHCSIPHWCPSVCTLFYAPLVTLKMQTVLCTLLYSRQVPLF